MEHKKNPDSSPASNIWERNYRDCVAKLRIIMELNKHFFELHTGTDPVCNLGYKFLLLKGVAAHNKEQFLRFYL